MSKPDGGPAFPGIETPGGGYPGMSLRDHFASHALVGLISDPSVLTLAHITGPEGIAVSAYTIADAMLAEREK